jgi:cell division protein FtsN
MKNFIAGCLMVIAGSWSGVQAQNRPGAFATVPVPGQVQVPTAPAPQVTTPPPTPAAPRPAVPTQPGQQQQQEQLRIVADPATNSLVVYGTVQEYQNVKNILKDLDAIPRQVLIEALILQIDLSDTEDFGVDYELFRKSRQTIFGQTFGSNAAITTLGTLFPAAPAFAGVAGLSAIVGDDRVSAMIRAAATNSRIKLISSPSVIASDNKPARIQVGSEEPVATGTIAQAVGGVSQSTSIQYRNTGRILTIIPQVNSRGLVNLQIKAEVSARGEDVTVGQDTFPAFNTQDAETTAVVQDGETLVIGGLIGELKRKGRSGIPYLMDIPVIGRFFGTTNDATDRTELIMLITPRVIRNRDEARIVTSDFKAGLEKVRAELERLVKDRDRLLPPRPPPPLPDPNQYYQYDRQQPEPVMPPVGPRAALPAFIGNVTLLSNDPLTGRMMPPMAVPQAIEPVWLAQNYQPAVTANIQPKHSPPMPPEQVLSFIQAVAVPVTVPTPPAAASKPVQPQNPTASRRTWTVQVAAIAESSGAESLAQKLRRLGYHAYVRVTHGNHKVWHRVRVGEMESHKDAAELRRTLIAQSQYKDAYIAAY